MEDNVYAKPFVIVSFLQTIANNMRVGPTVIMLLCRLEDNVWDVPVVVFCVWTVVLVISSLIVLSCLKRETKKFNKRLARADSKVIR